LIGLTTRGKTYLQANILAKTKATDGDLILICAAKQKILNDSLGNLRVHLGKTLGLIKENQFTKLRRLGGLDGHPDVSIRGIEANTGSLGMGISKAKGYAWAKKYLKKKGDVIVLIGDGEFQEGQIFESLQNSAHQKISNLIVIMDHNKIQSSDYVKNIINLRDLKKKISSFGWEVEQCDGHNFKVDATSKCGCRL
jgi:transketolase N-terminal domain/subunit